MAASSIKELCNLEPVRQKKEYGRIEPDGSEEQGGEWDRRFDVLTYLRDTVPEDALIILPGDVQRVLGCIEGPFSVAFVVGLEDISELKARVAQVSLGSVMGMEVWTLFDEIRCLWLAVVLISGLVV